jgi:hypothetical protein
MALTFARASSKYLTNSSTAVLTAPPITVALWYYPTNNTNDQELFSITDNSADARDAIRLSCNMSLTDPMQMVLRHVAAENDLTSGSITPTINTWNHCAGTIDGSLTQRVYLNGTKTGVDITGVSGVTGLSRTNIAAYIATTTIINPVDGRIAEVAVWNVALTANEILALALGLRAYMVRPLSIAGYWPMDGLVSPEPDLSGRKIAMTLVNAPVRSNGPPVTYFTPKAPAQAILAVAAAPALSFTQRRQYLKR